MNQILETSSEKRGKSPKNGLGGSSSDKIIKVFAIILMFFAIFLIGSGVYSLIKNKEASTPDTTATANKTTVKATINAIMDESNGKVILTVECKNAIDKVIYNWNTNTEMTVDGQKEKSVEKNIDLPSGSNTLNVKVIDIEGNETKESFDFDSEAGDDIISPNLTLTVTENKKLLITATDETEMSFLTYRWNDEPETTVKVDKDATDKTKLSVEIDIPKGTNTITVVAVDASSKYNTTTETKTLNGVTKPEITYELSADGSEITFHCTHEDGIKEIKYTLNGQEYAASYTEETGYPTDATFSQKWDEGYNKISLTVTSTNDTEGNFEGEYNYGTSSETTTDSSNTTNTANETNTANTSNEANTANSTNSTNR